MNRDRGRVSRHHHVGSARRRVPDLEPLDASGAATATIAVGALEQIVVGSSLEHPEVVGHRLIDGRVDEDLPALEQDAAPAQRLDDGEVVRDEDDRPPVARHLAHLAQRLSLESRIAHRQHLVDEQDLGLEVGGHGKGQAHRHPAGVPLDRGVEEPLNLGELHDLIEPPADLCPSHPEDRAVEEDVLAPGQIGMEAGAHLEQRADATGHVGAPARGLGDPRDDLQQGRLAGAVVPDQPDDLALADGQG